MIKIVLCESFLEVFLETKDVVWSGRDHGSQDVGDSTCQPSRFLSETNDPTVTRQTGNGRTEFKIPLLKGRARLQAGTAFWSHVRVVTVRRCAGPRPHPGSHDG